MRSRSITILCENDNEGYRDSETELSDEDKINSSFTNNFKNVDDMSLLVHNNNNNFKKNYSCNRNDYKHYEEWQENETFILIRAIENCIKENDLQRLIELKKAILSLEYEQKNYNIFETEKPRQLASDKKILACNEDKSYNEQYPYLMNEENINGAINDEGKEKINYIISQNIKEYREINILIVGRRTKERSELVSRILKEEIKDFTFVPKGGIEIKTKLLNEYGESIKFKIFVLDLDCTCENIKNLYFNLAHYIIFINQNDTKKTKKDIEFWIDSLKKRNLKHNSLLLFLQINKCKNLASGKHFSKGFKLINTYEYKKISISDFSENNILKIRSILLQKRPLVHSKGIQINFS